MTPFSTTLPSERRGFRPSLAPRNIGRRFKGGSKGGASSKAADRAREDEQERQADIRSGTDRINQIFQGTAVGANPATRYDPNATYYTASGEQFEPTTRESRPPKTFFGHMIDPGDPGMGDPMDLLRQGQLFTGTQQQGGFGDDFYKGREKAFLDYANPQLEDQYGDATKSLTFALARNGLLDSSVRAARSADLAKDYDIQRQGIADKALDYSNQARNQVEQSRQGLITTLNATGDASGAAQSAINEAQNLTAAPAFDPLASLFLNATQGLATQADLERRGQSVVNTGLFKPRRSSASVVS